MLGRVLYFLLVGLIAGWITSVIFKGRGLGMPRNITLGCLGAIIGGFIYTITGLRATGFFGAIIMSVSGAIVLIILIGYISRKK